MIVGIWYSSKRAMNDLSQILTHNLAKWGPISPAMVLILRVFSSQPLCTWRMHALQCVEDYLLQQCLTYQSFLHQCHWKGRSFESLLECAFHSITIPGDVPGVVCLPAAMQLHARPRKPKGHQQWAEYNSDTWKAFRLNGTSRTGEAKHVVVKLSDFYRSGSSYCTFCTISSYDIDKRQGESICLYGGGQEKTNLWMHEM